MSSTWLAIANQSSITDIKFSVWYQALTIRAYCQNHPTQEEPDLPWIIMALIKPKHGFRMHKLCKYSYRDILVVVQVHTLNTPTTFGLGKVISAFRYICVNSSHQFILELNFSWNKKIKEKLNEIGLIFIGVCRRNFKGKIYHISSIPLLFVLVFNMSLWHVIIEQFSSDYQIILTGIWYIKGADYRFLSEDFLFLLVSNML